ncbi:MAG TPA: cupin domain-containing protein [Prolixibacteraceae bacterium]|nr:cupin domain-containing protein [Prolixibacteraceae bacterium]
MRYLSILFILFLLTYAGFSQSPSKETLSGDTARWTLERCVNSFSFADTVGTAAGYQYWFADKNFLDGQTLKLSVVKPHAATHPPHAHTEDEFFFVLEGKARLFLAGDSIDVLPYSSFYCPSGIEHGIRNAGDSELKYLVIKKYLLKKEK